MQISRLSILGLFIGLLACTDQPSEASDKAPVPNEKTVMNIPESFDWQGHRGARGLMPENTIPAMLKALEYPEITTLELDVAITKDDQVILSHEPWMSSTICRQPDGSPIPGDEEKTFRIFEMTYEEIRQFDCGSNTHPNFPEQEHMTVAKPLLDSVFAKVDAWCAANNRELPNYNIELKSQPEYEGVLTPKPSRFAELVLGVVRNGGLRERVCIQSFDARSLQAVHKLDPDLTTAWLVADGEGIQANLEELGFLPTIYSPYYKLLSANAVKECHEQGLQVIPWTVNGPKEMRALIQMGVDGIITDYPNRIGELGKGVNWGKGERENWRKGKGRIGERGKGRIGEREKGRKGELEKAPD